MTTKEFSKLKHGTPVVWREGPLSPKAGELTDTGFVVNQAKHQHILWSDGQMTDGRDESALSHVEVS